MHVHDTVHSSGWEMYYMLMLRHKRQKKTATHVRLRPLALEEAEALVWFPNTIPGSSDPAAAPAIGDNRVTAQQSV